MEFSWEFLVSAGLLIFLAKNYKATIYYLKFNYYYGMVTAVVTILIPYFMLKPKNVLNFLVSSAGCRHVSKVIGITWTLRGSENLSKDRTCVIVANHQSSLDVQGMMDVWPVIRKMTAIAKRELLFAGSFGISMFLAGLTFIDRSAGGKAGDAMNNAMEISRRRRSSSGCSRRARVAIPVKFTTSKKELFTRLFKLRSRSCRLSSAPTSLS